MGTYDNEAGIFIFDQAVMDAHWLEHEPSGQVFIIGRSGDGFESHGGDGDELEALLFTMTDEQLSDETLMSENEFALVPDSLRRYNEESGYYHA